MINLVLCGIKNKSFICASNANITLTLPFRFEIVLQSVLIKAIFYEFDQFIISLQENILFSQIWKQIVFTDFFTKQTHPYITS